MAAAAGRARGARARARRARGGVRRARRRDPQRRGRGAPGGERLRAPRPRQGRRLRRGRAAPRVDGRLRRARRAGRAAAAAGRGLRADGRGRTGARSRSRAVAAAAATRPGRHRKAEPCAEAARQRGAAATSALVRAEGRRRMAELAWRAAELAAEHGWDGAWRLLLDRALAGSAGRRSQTERERAALGRRVSAALAPEPLRALRALAVAPAARAGAADTDGSAARPAAARPSPAVMIEALRADGAGGAERLLGRGRAAEVGWNAALPLLAAAAAASGHAALARANAALVERWPARAPVRAHARARRAARAASWRRRAARAGSAAPPGVVVRARRLRGLPALERRRPGRCGGDHAAPAARVRPAGTGRRLPRRRAAVEGRGSARRDGRTGRGARALRGRPAPVAATRAAEASGPW